MSCVELTIEKLVYGGDGLARLAPDGGQPRAIAVFVPYVLPAERVEASLVEERPGFARGRAERLLEASPVRVEPPCPYFGACGGCHYQHASYDAQLRFKSEILRETLRRTAKLDLRLDIQVHASLPLAYRNRTRFHVRSRPEFAIGYFKHGSHELLPVRECPISSPLINRMLAKLWRLDAGSLPEGIGEIELFANAADDKLQVELYRHGNSHSHQELTKFARDLAIAAPEIHGIVSLARSKVLSRSLDQPKSELLYGEDAMTYEVSGENYRVSAGAFFQVNRNLLPRMRDLVVNGRKGRVALDLYSGVGLFAVPLAQRFERVIAVESSPLSSADLRVNAPPNVKVSTQSTEAYLTAVAGTLRPDVIVADPPRAGLGPKVCAQISKLAAPEIIYVSCDPATLARDVKQLTSEGWQISEMHLIDLFPQTFHIETCTVLRRE